MEALTAFHEKAHDRPMTVSLGLELTVAFIFERRLSIFCLHLNKQIKN
jgi:hypothetical protein